IGAKIFNEAVEAKKIVTSDEIDRFKIEKESLRKKTQITQIDSKILDALQFLNIPDVEIKVYTTLMSLRNASESILSKVMKIEEDTIKTILSKLKDRKWITEQNGPKLIDDISKHLPFYWSHNNPVDLVATRNPNAYRNVIELMLNSDCFDVILTMSSARFLDRMKLLKPINDYGKKLVGMMLHRMGDRRDKAIENEIELCQKFPGKKLIYISFSSGLGDITSEKYDEKKIMVFGGSPENAGIVLKKLHDYQKFV
ncbi:unnamed protein product, partial [marine sediment metagenome]